MQHPSPSSRDRETSEARERIIEIGEILAHGLVRLGMPKSTALLADRGEGSLACGADQSGHANSETENAK